MFDVNTFATTHIHNTTRDKHKNVCSDYHFDKCSNRRQEPATDVKEELQSKQHDYKYNTVFPYCQLNQ